MSINSTNLKSHFFIIDFLKTLAVQIIILHHLNRYGVIPLQVAEIYPQLVNWISDYGRFAVQIFLVMGGYLTAKSLPNSLAKVGFIKSVVNRYLRLAPSYIVALCITIACAAIARGIHYDDYIGEPEELIQILAHFIFLQKIFNFESISVGVWYLAIDWQLYVFIAFLVFTLQSFKHVLLVLFGLVTLSLLYFSTQSFYEDYFIYFVGAYGLGVIAYLTEDSSPQETRSIARIFLVFFTLLVIVDTFFEWRPKNVIDIVITLILTWKGKLLYSSINVPCPKIFIWFSQRSYCAFLIHFSLLLLGNAAYFKWQLQSTNLALVMLIGMWLCSWVMAHALYTFVEMPSRKFQLS
jgi:peptidoglycan/LPS O-acetylase OafA/YrhL